MRMKLWVLFTVIGVGVFLALSIIFFSSGWPAGEVLL